MTSTALAAVVQQAGGEMLPADPKGVWINRFEIKSGSSNRLYTIAQKAADGTWGCSCPAWRTRRTCKHLTALNPALATIGAPKPAQPAPWPVLVAPREGK